MTCGSSGKPASISYWQRGKEQVRLFLVKDLSVSSEMNPLVLKRDSVYLEQQGGNCWKYRMKIEIPRGQIWNLFKNCGAASTF